MTLPTVFAACAVSGFSASPSRHRRPVAPGIPGHVKAPECKAAEGLSKISDDSPQADIVDLAAQARCRVVLAVVEELVMMVGDRKALRRDRRRMMTHVRQIAMYVSHVVLQVSLTDIGTVFGRDRTTVRYACHVVEDRRDDQDFDAFIASVERVVGSLFGLEEQAHA